MLYMTIAREKTSPSLLFLGSLGWGAHHCRIHGFLKYVDGRTYLCETTKIRIFNNDSQNTEISTVGYFSFPTYEPQSAALFSVDRLMASSDQEADFIFFICS